eukprot:scaffold13411_cov105-Isochrysis_galbana.AAC.1
MKKALVPLQQNSVRYQKTHFDITVALALAEGRVNDLALCFEIRLTRRRARGGLQSGRVGHGALFTRLDVRLVVHKVLHVGEGEVDVNRA